MSELATEPTPFDVVMSELGDFYGYEPGMVISGLDDAVETFLEDLGDEHEINWSTLDEIYTLPVKVGMTLGYLRAANEATSTGQIDWQFAAVVIDRTEQARRSDSSVAWNPATPRGNAQSADFIAPIAQAIRRGAELINEQGEN